MVGLVWVRRFFAAGVSNRWCALLVADTLPSCRIDPSIKELRFMRVLLLHGPNLNRLGSRNPEIYGTVTLHELVHVVTEKARERGLELFAFQSNHEGALIDWLQEKAANADAIIVNPGGLSHTSVSLRDALEDAGRTIVEVHISDPSAREVFRRTMITATAASKVIAGKGVAGYFEAIDFIADSKSAPTKS
jgi:3-dehydroquinate dehydratase-2